MIKLVAKHVIKNEEIEQFIDLCKELVESTRKEKGCLVYELYQDEKNPAILTMIEGYADRQALDDHLKTEYFKRIIQSIGAKLAGEPEVNVYQQVL